MPLQPDGRIRSKDIGTGEVNSRVIDDLRSSNYDGSKTDPDQNPGTQGWQILKSGKAIFNNVLVRGRIVASSIEGGTITGATIEGAELIGQIIDGATITGGTINIGDGLVFIDNTGIQVGSAPVVLNSGGLDIGSGLVQVDSTGLQVGSNVVIDSAGLKIGGVLQPAIETIRASGSFQNVSLGTSFTNLVSLNLSIPSFATVVDVMAIGRLQIANTSGGTQSFEARCSVAGGATDTARSYADNNLSANVTATRADRVTGSPSTVNVLLEGRVTSGSNSSNVGRLNVMATARRVA